MSKVWSLVEGNIYSFIVLTYVLCKIVTLTKVSEEYMGTLCTTLITVL